MKTQTNGEKPEIILPALGEGLLDVLRDHSEIERIEFLAITMDDGFKNDLMMCNANMMETGKANAFALYKKPEGVAISDPVFAEPEYGIDFSKDPAHCVWREETKVDEVLGDNSSKKQKLLCTWDGELGCVVPRTDVLGYVVGFPMGKLYRRGLKAQDIRRPTLDFLDLYLQQEQLHPGFIGGILTNDGNKSGLILFKKSEDVERVDKQSWGHLGNGDEIDRDLVLGAMGSAGLVYADIDLSCPKNCDPDRSYERRVSKAVNSLYQSSSPRVH